MTAQSAVGRPGPTSRWAVGLGALLLLPACGLTETDPPELVAVDPDIITTRGAEVRVLGRNLWARPSVDLSGSEAPSIDRKWRVVIDADRLADDAVTWVDSETLDVLIPPGLTPGLKDVTAISPDGTSALLPDGLTVLDEAEITLRIEDAPGGTGDAIGDVTLRIGQQVVLYAVGRNGAEITDVAVDFSVEGSAGDVDAATGSQAVFEAAAPGTAVVTGYHPFYGTDSTGTITVQPCASDAECADVCRSTSRCEQDRCVPGPVDKDSDGDGAIDIACEGGDDCDDDPGACGDACFPGNPADDVCDGADQDCDGDIDEDADQIWYEDADGDGYGDAASTTLACDQPAGYLADDTDCDDTDELVHPGATEQCNGRDDNCDGTPDEGVSGGGPWYQDADGDGFGDASAPHTGTSCAAPNGYVSDDTDCDDDPSGCGADCYPGAPELCDNVDNDCDPATADGLDQQVGDPCDGPDLDRCFDDTVSSCSGGVLVCSTGPDDAEGPVGDPRCSDGVDNDCDGLTDDLDPTCSTGFCGDDWCWMNPLPCGNSLHGVWVSETGNVWAIEARGILSYDPTTGSWSRTRIDQMSWEDVFGFSDTDIYAVGGGGRILHYDGVVWTELFTVASSWLQGVWGTSSSDLYTVGFSGEVVYHDGTNWTLEPNVTSERLQGVWGAATDDVWAVGENATVLRKTGGVWASVVTPATGTLSGVWGSAANDVWMVGPSGTVIHYDGAFSAVDIGATGTLSHVWGSAASDVWVVGTGGAAYHHNGFDWVSVDTGTDAWLQSVRSNPSGVTWAVGEGCAVVECDGTTRSCTDHSGGTRDTVYALWGTAVDDVWAAGMGGTILHHDGTPGFQEIPSGTGQWIQDLWGTDAGNVWAVGAGGTTLNWDGSNWTDVANPTGETLVSVSGTNQNDVWAVGYNGVTLHWDGSWTQIATPTSDRLLGVWAAATDDVWAVGEAGRILHYDGIWRIDSSVVATADLQDVWGCSSNDVWVVGDGGTILRNTGSGWVSAASPTTVDLHGIWGNGCSDLWIAATSGRIYHWDGVDPWVRVQSPSTAPFNDVWVDAAGGAWVGGSYGNIVYHQPGVTD